VRKKKHGMQKSIDSNYPKHDLKHQHVNTYSAQCSQANQTNNNHIERLQMICHITGFRSASSSIYFTGSGACSEENRFETREKKIDIEYAH
jgi:ABC-type microcin C transport system permease subunit YejB